MRNNILVTLLFLLCNLWAQDDDLDLDNEEDGGIISGDDEDDNEESGVGVVESKV